MATQHESRNTEKHTVFHIEPYTRAQPMPDPTIVCRVVIPGAAVVCTRIVSRDATSFPSHQVRGLTTPDRPS
jgi:hypothetical protein